MIFVTTIYRKSYPDVLHPKPQLKWTYGLNLESSDIFIWLLSATPTLALVIVPVLRRNRKCQPPHFSPYMLWVLKVLNKAVSETFFSKLRIELNIKNEIKRPVNWEHLVTILVLNGLRHPLRRNRKSQPLHFRSLYVAGIKSIK